jgi:hypothetical protein
MPHEWITDRLPTVADADGYLVQVPQSPDSHQGGKCWQHYSLIIPGQPWWSPRVPERVEVEPAPAPTLSFAVGQQWRNRNGQVVTITEIDHHANTAIPILADNGFWYRADGTSCINHSEDDLIELVSGPEPAPAPAPTRKVVQIAVGVELLALCDDGTMWAISKPGGPWTQIRAIPQPEA